MLRAGAIGARLSPGGGFQRDVLMSAAAQALFDELWWGVLSVVASGSTADAGAGAAHVVKSAASSGTTADAGTAGVQLVKLIVATGSTSDAGVAVVTVGGEELPGVAGVGSTADAGFARLSVVTLGQRLAGARLRCVSTRFALVDVSGAALRRPDWWVAGRRVA